MQALNDYLERFESAPSALALLVGIYEDRILTDEEVSTIYELPEGECDSRVSKLVASLSDRQLIEFYESALINLMMQVED